MSNTNIEYFKELNRSIDFKSEDFIRLIPHLYELLIARKQTAIMVNTVVLETAKKSTKEQYSYINNEIKKLLNL